MRGEMERAAAAIQEARKLADRPRGRFQIAYSRDYISTLMPNIRWCRAIIAKCRNIGVFA
ncbi:MAG TPA: hypothetical protein VKA46_06540 [Gemmataceae bacterium]|nr:hypothetical protein [Gemmataceae bacterium]